MRLAGSTFVVTGGASGLGEAVCRGFVKSGANVVIADLNDERGVALQNELGEAKALFIKTDVTSQENVADMVAKTLAKFGSVHGAINCAGIAFPQRTVTEKRVADQNVFEKVVQINLSGSYNVVRQVAAAARATKPNEEGERAIFVLVASVAAFDGQIGQCSYAASKGGLASMTLPLARELAPFGMRAVTVAPGVFDTPMFAMLPVEAKEKLIAQVPFPRRLGYATEFASLCQQVVENPMLNGDTIRLDGAIRMAAM